jgi:hypothetical protein
MFLGPYVAYGLVQVSLKTVDKSCGTSCRNPDFWFHSSGLNDLSCINNLFLNLLNVDSRFFFKFILSNVNCKRDQNGHLVASNHHCDQYKENKSFLFPEFDCLTSFDFFSKETNISRLFHIQAQILLILNTLMLTNPSGFRIQKCRKKIRQQVRDFRPGCLKNSKLLLFYVASILQTTALLNALLLTYFDIIEQTLERSF